MTTGTTNKDTLAARLDTLPKASLDELRQLWRKLYRAAPPPRISRDLLTLAVAWKLQADVLGGLGPAVQRKLAGLETTMAAKGDLARPRTLQPRPGARLLRLWQGETHTVLVREEGFEWQGTCYPSLSAIARRITGTRWSGPRFFGLDKPARAVEARVDG